MDEVGLLVSRIDALREALRNAPPSAALRTAFHTLRREEIEGSIRLAGAELDRAEVRALLERGRALGGHRLEDYLVVRGYAAAAAWAAQRAGRREHLVAEDLRTLHRLTVRGLSDDGGAWRIRNLPALADGTVPAPHWLVPFEVETLVGRLAIEEDEPAPLALAHAIARLTRLQPFASGNGRLARLVANVLAYRRGLPPLAFDARTRRAYIAALRAADARDVGPLANVVARTLVRGLERLRDVAEHPPALEPLAAFADVSADALYKAAQRGRLRVVRRNGRLYTTRAWVDAYKA